MFYARCTKRIIFQVQFVSLWELPSLPGIWINSPTTIHSYLQKAVDCPFKLQLSVCVKIPHFRTHLDKDINEGRCRPQDYPCVIGNESTFHFVIGDPELILPGKKKFQIRLQSVFVLPSSCPVVEAQTSKWTTKWMLEVQQWRIFKKYYSMFLSRFQSCPVETTTYHIPIQHHHHPRPPLPPPIFALKKRSRAVLVKQHESQLSRNK